MVILLMFTIYPLFYGIYLSLHSWDFGAPLETMKWAGFTNFIRIFSDASFWSSAKNTLFFIIFGVTGQFLLGFALASLVVKKRNSSYERLIWFVRPLILLPMIVSPVVVGLMWRQLYNFELGMFNYLFGLIGIPPQAWMTDLRFVLPAVIITDIWEWTPFMFLIFLSGLSTIPPAPIESARVDGANKFQILRHITLPLMGPLILVAVLIRGIDVIKIFDLVYIMTSGGPGNATETLSLFAYRNAFLKSDIGYGAALSFFLTFVVTIVGLFTVKKLYKEVD